MNIERCMLCGRKIMVLCNKKRLSKAQSVMRTNRYLTLKILNEVPFEEYDNYKSLLQQEIVKIKKSTKVEELESLNEQTRISCEFNWIEIQPVGCNL